MDKIDSYWLDVSDLTISDAAIWMATGGDPREHERLCEDDAYAECFSLQSGGFDLASKCCALLASAVREGCIKATSEIHRSDQSIDTALTFIRKSDWLAWCRISKQSRFVEFADLFEGNLPLGQISTQPWDEPGLTKREQQMRAIEAVTDDLKYNRMSIPDDGKQAVKRKCLSEHPNLFGAGVDPFKEAWQEAVNQKRIRMMNHEQYSKR